jgi:hypothetical protein
MSSNKLTAAEVAGWLTPEQAIEILAAKYGTGDDCYTAKHTLLQRLQGGRVRAASDPHDELVVVGPDSWSQVKENDIFWESGDLTFTRDWEPVRFFDVRFEPDAVRAIIANAVATGLSAPAKAEGSKRTRLPDPHLEAWFEFYKKIGGALRENPAMAHVDMCFPNNSVSRQRIRDLIGPRTLGRPKTGGE